MHDTTGFVTEYGQEGAKRRESNVDSHSTAVAYCPNSVV